ncbi:zinc-binding dehydrogenase [Candidatus Poribacteria bacterium]|nr:zinc-binding dehydrogenase [Candidatus Poribacteria bacterium]MBT5536211.1 zinc-binding dehydrogenase [Candidatus Poribacteria bacterium]MBT5709772.1 zinc-binding dehydrogenase [Candidatus Poribacteria bacterium]MBT7101041.1 zinc-binding dehydrogenase [Candidatus Poribacteria bacterium]MBT7806292.1 zinc-binding dehydrogenase [Candidatus Poribacteria bacterium]
MRAARLIAPRTYDMVDIPVPSLAGAGPDRVVVKTNRVCLCASDMPYFSYDRGTYPQPPGLSAHECLGTVAESTSPRLAVGDQVLSVPDGQHGMAEYFLADAVRTVHLPDGFSNEILMAQPLGTVIWACRKLPNMLGAKTVVYGQGPMGLLFNRLFSNLGAKTIVGVERVPERLALAEAMGATHVVNSGEEDVVARVRDITGGEMADIVVEIVGHNTETLAACVSLVRREGTVLAFGVPDDAVYPVPFGEMFGKNISLISSVGPDCQHDYPLAIDMIHQGRLDVTPILSHDMPFTTDDVQTGYELFVGRKEGAVKVMIHME